MKYRVTHTTKLNYEASVGICYNEARLLPYAFARQQVLDSNLQIEPLPQDIYERLDYFGNRTTYFSIQRPHEEMKVTATSEVDIRPGAAIDSSPPWESIVEQLRNPFDAETIAARQFSLDSPMVRIEQELAEYAEPSFVPGRPYVDAVNDLMQKIFNEFKYDPEFSSIATPLKEVMQHRSGVCQDFAHLAIGCLRARGLAARYVSGYIETLPPPGKEKLVGADASHAWFSVFIPGSGWLDFDPTNNKIPTDQHITVAWGRDFSDVTPLKGVAYGGGKHELDVAVDVTPIE